MTIELTWQRARSELQAIVAEEGEDFVYTAPDQAPGKVSTGTCVYVCYDTDGRLCPSCLIGRLLVRLGVPLSWFTNVRKYSQRTFNTYGAGDVIRALRGDGIIRVEDIDLVARYLRKVQVHQDRKDTWGEALRGGDRFLEEEGVLAASPEQG